MDLPYFREGSGLGGTLKEDEERATLGDAKSVPATPVSSGGIELLKHAGWEQSLASTATLGDPVGG